MPFSFVLRNTLFCLFALFPIQLYAEWGRPIVDAYLLPEKNDGRGRQAFFTLVSWDGSFLDERDGKKDESITTRFESRFGDDGSTPHVSIWPALLNAKYATEQVNKILNSFPWSPAWHSGFPTPYPRYFTLTFSGSSGAYYSLFVQVRNWSNVEPPAECTTQAGNMNLGSLKNTDIVSANVLVRLRCNADTNYKMTVGTANGQELVPYTSGGKVRMSIDGGKEQHPNTFIGHAEKNLTTQISVRATTVSGTALPGKYSASAIVSIELL